MPTAHLITISERDFFSFVLWYQKWIKLQNKNQKYFNEIENIFFFVLLGFVHRYISCELIPIIFLLIKLFCFIFVFVRNEKKRFNSKNKRRKKFLPRHLKIQNDTVYCKKKMFKLEQSVVQVSIYFIIRTFFSVISIQMTFYVGIFKWFDTTNII